VRFIVAGDKAHSYSPQLYEAKQDIQERSTKPSHFNELRPL